MNCLIVQVLIFTEAVYFIALHECSATVCRIYISNKIQYNSTMIKTKISPTVTQHIVSVEYSSLLLQSIKPLFICLP